MAVCLGSGKYKINVGGLALVVQCPNILPENIFDTTEG